LSGINGGAVSNHAGGGRRPRVYSKRKTRRSGMKKGMLCFLLCGFSALCFAKGNFEFYGGLPLYFEQTDAGDSRMSSLSLGFAGISPLNEFIALGVYDNFVFPLKLDTETDGLRITTKRDDYDFLFGAGMLLGPALSLYSSKKLKIPLAVGPHFFLLASSAGSVSTLDFEFGLGVNLGLEYSLTRWLYVLGRIEATWDFYGLTRSVSGSQSRFDSGSLAGLGINPNIGIGFRL
jgi:hypothetical protein